jgi:hypothetical protein
MAPGEDIFRFLANGSVQRYRQMRLSFWECYSSPSVALGEDDFPRVSPFPECHGFCDTRESLSSPSVFLPRVQHSGKIGFPECPIFGTRGRVRYLGNLGSPVVDVHGRGKKGPCSLCQKVFGCAFLLSVAGSVLSNAIAGPPIYKQYQTAVGVLKKKFIFFFFLTK